MSDSLLKLAEDHKVGCEKQLAEALADSIIASSPVIDRYSSWFLGVAGATAVVMVSSLGDLAKLLGEAHLKVAGALLVTSGLLGLLAKARAHSIEMFASGSRDGHERTRPIVEKHNAFTALLSDLAEKHGIPVDAEVDPRSVILRVASYFPRPVSWVYHRRLEALLRNPGSATSGALAALVWQSSYTSLQVVALVAFFLLVVGFGVAI